MLKLHKISKSYKTGTFIQKALNDINLNFRQNEFVAILGPSGSGKTTLLNIIGGLDRYDTGDLLIKGKSTKKFKDKDWDAYRNKSVGFIFQSYNLISHISILDNIEMGMTLSGKKGKVRKRKALELLKKVGLLEHKHKKPNQLSGGQMQRVAIARALANDPEIILADEPTGALDTKTSKQIMELIKEIAKDKLVIMVTHNPELASTYADRIINMQDGKIVSDTNEASENDVDNSYKLKKTKMSFFTALHLSLNNIRTKKGRTILTAFASSIGIIGIAIILALSNGFSKQIDNFEQETSDAMPIIISLQNMNIESGADLGAAMNSEMGGNAPMTKEEKKREYTNEKNVTAMKQKEVITLNNITSDYVDYIKKIEKNYISSVALDYGITFNMIQKLDDKYVNVNTLKVYPTSIPCKNFDDDSEGQIFANYYDLIEGRYAKNKNEIMIQVDTANRVHKDLLKALGINKENATFDEIIGSTLKLVRNDDYYSEFNGLYVPNEINEDMYNNSNNLELKVVGIIRMSKKKEGLASSSNTQLIIYHKSLEDYILNIEKDSKIVKAQKDAKYDVRTGMPYDDTMNGKIIQISNLNSIGGSRIPLNIMLYPKDFKSKDKVIKYLDKYNEDKNEKDKVGYLDQAKLITNISDGIMSGITIVLVAFSSISLVVSSIMLGIITYISVLERTKEIGILRSLGARKKDIRRVFSAETFIIGFASGILGILIAYILTIPINKILHSLTKLENVAVLNPMHAVLLVTISIILTLIGGAIPARMASRRDPVIALRTE